MKFRECPDDLIANSESFGWDLDALLEHGGWRIRSDAEAVVVSGRFDGWERNGFARSRQTAAGELRIEIPQVRAAAMPFVSKLFPR